MVMVTSTERLRTRRALLFSTGALLLAPGLVRAQPKLIHAEVWKSPTCGCCKVWVEHLEANGFMVKVHDMGNAATRQRLRIPVALGSCHTALVGRWAVEGHVPAADIQRLIRQAPDAIGLAVPGMPIGSPGMDGPEYGSRRDRYQVLLVHKDGSTSVFATHS
jgi:hypothetical protein